jgi:hypothetical protein
MPDEEEGRVAWSHSLNCLPRSRRRPCNLLLHDCLRLPACWWRLRFILALPWRPITPAPTESGIVIVIIHLAFGSRPAAFGGAEEQPDEADHAPADGQLFSLVFRGLDALPVQLAKAGHFPHRILNSSLFTEFGIQFVRVVSPKGDR